MGPRRSLLFEGSVGECGPPFEPLLLYIVHIIICALALLEEEDVRVRVVVGGADKVINDRARAWIYVGVEEDGELGEGRMEEHGQLVQPETILPPVWYLLGGGGSRSGWGGW